MFKGALQAVHGGKVARADEKKEGDGGGSPSMITRPILGEICQAQPFKVAMGTLLLPMSGYYTPSRPQRSSLLSQKNTAGVQRQ